MLILGGVAMMLLGILAPAMGGGADGTNPLSAMGGAIPTIGVGILYFVMAIAYVYPALKLTKFSKKVSALVNSPSEEGLASALNEQRAFWKYVGIMVIAFIILYIVLIAGVVAFGIFGARAMSGVS